MSYWLNFSGNSYLSKCLFIPSAFQDIILTCLSVVKICWPWPNPYLVISSSSLKFLWRALTQSFALSYTYVFRLLLALLITTSLLKDMNDTSSFSLAAVSTPFSLKRAFFTASLKSSLMKMFFGLRLRACKKTVLQWWLLDILYPALRPA